MMRVRVGVALLRCIVVIVMMLMCVLVFRIGIVGVSGVCMMAVCGWR